MSDNDPAEYLPRVAEKYPGALESHWIPMDRSLWRIERYADFLAARRESLANAANRFLESLLQGTVPDRRVALDFAERPGLAPSVGTVRDEEEATRLEKLRRWLERKNLPLGEIDLELVDPNTNNLVVVDLAWPDGIQSGLSEPVALMLDEDDESITTAARAGMRVFTSVSRLRSYVRNEILAGDDESAEGESPSVLAATP